MLLSVELSGSASRGPPRQRPPPLLDGVADTQLLLGSDRPLDLVSTRMPVCERRNARMLAVRCGDGAGTVHDVRGRAEELGPSVPCRRITSCKSQGARRYVPIFLVRSSALKEGSTEHAGPGFNSLEADLALGHARVPPVWRHGAR